MKTTLAKAETVERKWRLIDAKGKILGRLAVQIANVLRGRDKVHYTPHVDTGDYVVVINSKSVEVTGKKEENKTYMSYSGYMGGEKYKTLATIRAKDSRELIHHAVKGMLPKNKLSRQMLKKLKVYEDENHPHESQNPVPFN